VAGYDRPPHVDKSEASLLDFCRVVRGMGTPIDGVNLSITFDTIPYAEAVTPSA